MEDSEKYLELIEKITTDSTSADAQITVVDELPPEANAMVQALNSRSAGGFFKNLVEVLKKGASKFMATFYSGYGHKSIADCGSTTVAVDNVSMLVAKAIQDWQLYSGQETSTRYIDTTELGFIDPIGTDESREIMKRWFAFYNEAQIPLLEHLKLIHLLKDGQDEKKWLKTLNTRVCDILGSFLPAGARTNVSAHMNLRQFDDKLSWLIHHPLPEVREVADKILELLVKKYSSTFEKSQLVHNSFSPIDEVKIQARELLKTKYQSTFEKLDEYGKSEVYRKFFMENNYYFDLDQHMRREDGAFILAKLYGVQLNRNFLHDMILRDFKDVIMMRPPKTDLPKILNETGSYLATFMIDFRSFRDLQRQRSAVQRMPLLTVKEGFETWYLNQMPSDLRVKAEKLLVVQQSAIEQLACDNFTRQYYIGMGFKVPCRFTMGLADLVYIIEIRSATTVHPTARKVALEMYERLMFDLPDYLINIREWFVVHADTSADDFDIKRADHDIFKREEKVPS